MAASIPFRPASTAREAGTGELALKERWYPIQVKQTDKAGRPDIDAFESHDDARRLRQGIFRRLRLFVGRVAGDRIILQSAATKSSSP